MPNFDFLVYIKSREELVTKHPQEFIDQLGTIQKTLYDNLLITIKGMDVKKGAALEASKMNLAMAHKLRTDMARWLRTEGYYDNIERFGKGYTGLIRESKKYYKAMGLNPAFTERDLNSLATIRKDDLNFLIKRDTDVINATYNEVLNSVYSKSDWRKLAQRLKEMHTDTVFENGKTLRGLLKKYSATYANTAFAGFDRRIQTIKAEQYGLEYFYYSGSLIVDSREFCASRVGKVFTKKEIDAWQSMKWTGKASGRDVWVFLGGFNCRHILNPVSKEYAKEIMGEGDDTTAQPDQFVPAVSTKEVINRFSNIGINRVELTGNLQTDNDMLSSFEGLNKKGFDLKEFRGIRGGKRGNAYAAYNELTGGINFNDEIFSKRGELLKSLNKNVENEFHPKGCNTIKSVFDHEYGHVLTHPSIIDKQLWDKYGRRFSQLQDSYFEEFESLKTKMFKEVPNSVAHKKILKELMDLKISNYSKENLDEFIAEAFSSYLNSPNPSKYAKKVYEIIAEMHL